MTPPLRTLLLVVLAACSYVTAPLLSRDERRELDLAQARWNARPFGDYTFETRTSCFCPPEINAWTRVYVRGGVVVRAESADTDPPVERATLTWWVPIDSTFARLRRDAANRDMSSTYSDIRVTFDATLGFPSQVDYIERPTVADAAFSTSIRNVRALQ